MAGREGGTLPFCLNPSLLVNHPFPLLKKEGNCFYLHFFKNLIFRYLLFFSYSLYFSFP